MTPAFFSSSRKVVATDDAVEHRIDGHARRALDAGEHLLLLERDAELLVGTADLGIELVERSQLRLLLRRRIIISVLVIDFGDVELGPADLLHLQPGAIGLQPPVEHPFAARFFLAEMKRTVSSFSPFGANSCSMSLVKPHS